MSGAREPKRQVVWVRLVSVRGWPGRWAIYHDEERASGYYRYRSDAQAAARCRAYTRHQGIKS